ncbi:unnamed protein product [Nesidiocoris tenuis]|uniref:Uncharacterized protein n=1 Tax=Nesidiocoris tenuis TaxID=355587 RepID=A0A6H5FUY0_9HEMI|nr:unnamed protein product [Nesidiocoris tenuis]
MSYIPFAIVPLYHSLSATPRFEGRSRHDELQSKSPLNDCSILVVLFIAITAHLVWRLCGGILLIRSIAIITSRLFRPEGQQATKAVAIARTRKNGRSCQANKWTWGV